MSAVSRPAPKIRLPDVPALVADHRGAAWLTADGEIDHLSPNEASRRARETPPILCHARATAGYLGVQPFPAFDLLELFAFVRPAQFCVPTPRGVADAVGLTLPDAREDQALGLFATARTLLEELAEARPGAAEIAWSMGRGGWPWAPAVLAVLGHAIEEDGKTRVRNPVESLRVWQRLKEWSEHAPPPQPGHIPLGKDEVVERLVALRGASAEDRPQQKAYAEAVAHAFAPADAPGLPRAVIAQAGTGTGKTLGYLAPASLWAEKNDGTVWISTYTRNLQRQLDGELDRLYPDPDEKALRAVVRKGRENYLCLLSFEESLGRLTARAEDATALGLVARWITATRDGDMVGGDFPAWLADLLGFPPSLGLTDRRGECIYSACSHYSKCFIERSIRRARRAKIVVANHALVMVQAAMGGGDDAYKPSRYVFDEGHHLFDAADSAFSAHLTGQETAELRRWLLGAEGRRGSRSRGLKARLDDLIDGDEKATDALVRLVEAARVLPGSGWLQRLTAANPVGPVETALHLIREQVYARDRNAELPYDLETEAQPPVPGLLDAAAVLADDLGGLVEPARALRAALAKQLDDKASELDTATRQRLESLVRSIERRALMPVQAWQEMLASLAQETPHGFVDRMAIDRINGRDIDIGLHRNWVDPTFPFVETVASTAEGILVTSATLKDSTGDEEADWQAALAGTGLVHLPLDAERIDLPSPFDYGAQTRVLVITDVSKNDADRAAAAYRELMTAAGGGGIGLFTSIARLRAIHKRLIAMPEMAAFPLFAQHIDPLDVGTLVDIFRAEENACLLGTDAVRDGVDVPGRSLRLLIYDRVPWPRPTILHRARKQAYEGDRYDDITTRLRLKQAYGRLIRQATDRGVFVILDRAMPSRLATAFPEGVDVQRIGLADAVRTISDFLGA